MALTTVDDVADMLRWGDAEKTKYQAQMPIYVAAAESPIEDEIGPVIRRSRVYIADGGSSVVLPYAVSSVESVTVDGAVVTGWVPNLAAGIVHGPFGRGTQNVVVTFTAGFIAPNANPDVPPDDLPEAIRLAATMVAADKWAIASQRAPGLDEQVDPSYLTPRAVRDLLRAFAANKMPGFA
jgi:hypothetical protein